MTNEKQHAHQLVENLNGGQLAALVHLLEVMVDPVAHSIANALVEEGDITAGMAAELDEAYASANHGEGIAHEEVLHRFSVTPGR